MRASKSLGELMSSSLKPLVAGSTSMSVGGAADIKAYPTDASEYEVLQECGRGVSATVYIAMCKRYDEVVAIKALNLDIGPTPIEELVKEAAVMRAYHHLNVLPLHCAFVHGDELWLVMPYCEGGSVAHILRYSYPEGLDEALVAAVMKQALQGLDYVHKHGGIHRDIKAGNLLLCGDGTVRLADFGVSAAVERGGEWGETALARRTFVGTPCWMAPEVLEQTQGYSTAADLWSFGITLLEMAHGHAPFARLPPMKVLLMTLQGPPPQLEERCGKHTFSRAMREVVALCLQKDPGKRPTAAQLLEHRFFKHAKDAAFIRRHLLEGLPPLPQRVADILAGKAALSAEQHRLQLVKSMVRYASDVAQWDFTCVTAPGNGDGSAGASGGAGGEQGAEAGAVPHHPAVPDDVITAVASDAQRAGVACYAGGQRLHLGPPSAPPSATVSPSSSLPPSRPTSPPCSRGGGADGAANGESAGGAAAGGAAVAVGTGSAAAAAGAPAKRHGRFVIYEGASPYQGPDEADAADRNSPKPDQSSPPVGLARQRSVSSPQLLAAAPEAPPTLISAGGAAAAAASSPRRRVDAGGRPPVLPPSSADRGIAASHSSPVASASPASSGHGSPLRSGRSSPLRSALKPSHGRRVSFPDQGAVPSPVTTSDAGSPVAAVAAADASASAGTPAGSSAATRLESLQSLPTAGSANGSDLLAAALQGVGLGATAEVAAPAGNGAEAQPQDTSAAVPAVAAAPPALAGCAAEGQRAVQASKGRFRVYEE